MLRHRAAVAALVCACIISACGDPPEEQQASTPAGGTVAQPKTTGAVPPDMVAAVSAGKASNAIGVHFALRAAPAVNTALPVDVVIVPHRDFSALRVTFDGQEGLTAVSGNTFGPQTNVKSETPLKHQLVLLPAKEGIFTVAAAVETDGADGNTVRIFSIPVIVAGAVAAAPAAAPAGPSAPPAEPARQ
jgi:hypothetical protein